MKKLLLVGALGIAAFMLFGKKDDESQNTLSTDYRELTDGEAQNYLAQNTDLVAVYGNNLENAKEHWRNWGWNEFSRGSRANPYLS